MRNYSFSHLPRPRQIGLILITLFLAALYIYGVQQQLTHLNADARMDQDAYMQMAKEMRLSNYTTITGRNRMPVYPFLQSLFYRPDMSDEAFLALGKKVNVALSLLILPLLFLLFQKFLPLWVTINLFLITTFTLFIFKAPFFQTELLFYLLNFIAFLMMVRMLHRPTWKWGLITGFTLAVAHLTKASILPGLGLFLVVALLKEISSFTKPSVKPSLPASLSAYALVILAFLTTIGPYIRTSKEKFGQYFYNVNSTFYIWYDSWDEVMQGTRAHGDRVGWPEMPAEQIPSAARYFQEHDLGQIGQRLWDGFLILFINVVFSYGYFKYFLIFTVVLATLVIVNRPHTMDLLRQHFFPVVFITGYFAGYFILYCWYAPITAGNRFILAQFIPYMFTAAFTIFILFKQQLSVRFNSQSTRQIELGRTVNVIVGLILVVDIYLIITDRIMTLFGGY